MLSTVLQMTQNIFPYTHSEPELLPIARGSDTRSAGCSEELKQKKSANRKLP